MGKGIGLVGRSHSPALVSDRRLIFLSLLFFLSSHCLACLLFMFYWKKICFFVFLFFRLSSRPVFFPPLVSFLPLFFFRFFAMVAFALCMGVDPSQTNAGTRTETPASMQLRSRQRSKSLSAGTFNSILKRI